MTREDAYPGYKNYPDRGCQFAPSCLDCPFPTCLLDEPPSQGRPPKQKRDSEVKRRFQEGEDVESLSSRFKVSVRTIWRILGSQR